MANPHNEATFDVAAIGNAIVDVLTHASEAFLAHQGLAKGGMKLIDADEATRLYAEMGAGVEASGGSAANTIGPSSLGTSASTRPGVWPSERCST